MRSSSKKRIETSGQDRRGARSTALKNKDRGQGRNRGRVKNARAAANGNANARRREQRPQLRNEATLEASGRVVRRVLGVRDRGGLKHAPRAGRGHRHAAVGVVTGVKGRSHHLHGQRQSKECPWNLAPCRHQQSAHMPSHADAGERISGSGRRQAGGRPRALPRPRRPAKVRRWKFFPAQTTNAARRS